MQTKIAEEQLDALANALAPKVAARIADELERRTVVESNSGEAWAELREKVLARLEKAGVSRYRALQVLGVVSTILRYRLGLRRVQYLERSQLPEALKVARTVLNLMKIKGG